MTSNIEATINQTVQAGFETSPGSGGAGTYKLQSLTYEPTDELATKTYKPQGKRFVALVEPDKQWTSFALNGDALYTEILLLLENAFGTASPTLFDVAGYKRIYDVKLSGIITPRTLYYQMGDTNNVNTFGYGVLQDIGMKFDREAGVSCTSTGFAQAKATGGAFTASPTLLGLLPILPTHLNYYLDTTGAGIGATQVPEEFLSVSFDYKGANNPYWATNRSQTSFDTHVNVQPTTEVKIDLAETPLSRSLDAAMSVGATYFLRIDAVGPTIPTSSPSATNLLDVDIAIKLTKKDKWQDKQGVFMRTWTFEIVEDATWGHAMMFTSQTGIATI